MTNDISVTSQRFPIQKITEVRNLLTSAKNIVITTHHRPDGDAMGSSLGLYNYLLRKKLNVTVITPSEYPDFLFWLPGHETVLNYETAGKESDELVANADIIFCLDFNWISRVETMQDSLKKSKAKKILLDHHLDPEPAFDIVFSFSDACSTSEILYDFILAMNDESLIDRNIAECIYCGIMTDTNSFRFSSMKARTHRIIASLMEAGAENFRIHERVYDNSNEFRLRLLGYALLEKLIVLSEYNTAYIVLTEEELKKYSFRSGDTEGFVNYALSIQGIRLAAFFSERDGSVKISFRSKNDFSVKELSAKYFEGGGHRNAAGGFSREPIDKVVKKFLDILPSYRNELTK